MDICHIVPAQNFDLMDGTPRAMFLTHLVEKYPHYATYARNYKGYKILDNSLIELGGAVNLKRVWDAAEFIKADEIILPDVYMQGPATIALVLNSLEQIPSRNEYSLMAVCQGKDIAEFEDCFARLANMDIDTIGIPKNTSKLHPAGRPAFEYLWQNAMCGKNIHLLGTWYTFAEYKLYEDPGGIRSVDTCLAGFFSNTYANTTTIDPGAEENVFELVRPDGHTLNLEEPLRSPELYRRIVNAVR